MAKTMFPDVHSEPFLGSLRPHYFVYPWNHLQYLCSMETYTHRENHSADLKVWKHIWISTFRHWMFLRTTCSLQAVFRCPGRHITLSLSWCKLEGAINFPAGSLALLKCDLLETMQSGSPCECAKHSKTLFFFFFNSKSASNSELPILNSDDCISPCLSAPITTDCNHHPQFPWHWTAM